MPETETEDKKNIPMVDIDTSGPEVEVNLDEEKKVEEPKDCLLYTSPSPRDVEESRMPSSA